MRDDSRNLLQSSLTIASGYNGNLTLRQLYYRLVAGGVLPNDTKAYNKLGRLLVDTRLGGQFPLEWLMDRTRESRKGDITETYTSINAAMRTTKTWVKYIPISCIRQSRWNNQAEYVLVAVEKEALAGVFEGPCKQLGVPWLVCRGYPSVSTVYQMVKQYREATRHRDAFFDRFIIIYFGDHDPDGLEIPEALARQAAAILDRIEIDSENEANPDSRKGSIDDQAEAEELIWMSGAPRPEIERVALTIEQIEEFNPPPFPAKVTSSRFANYQEKTGLSDAWELDALDPHVLEDLIYNSVSPHFSEEIWQEGLENVFSLRKTFTQELINTPWVAEALQDVDLKPEME